MAAAAQVGETSRLSALLEAERKALAAQAEETSKVAALLEQERKRAADETSKLSAQLEAARKAHEAEVSAARAETSNLVAQVEEERKKSLEETSNLTARLHEAAKLREQIEARAEQERKAAEEALATERSKISTLDLEVKKLALQMSEAQGTDQERTEVIAKLRAEIVHVRSEKDEELRRAHDAAKAEAAERERRHVEQITQYAFSHTFPSAGHAPHRCTQYVTRRHTHTHALTQHIDIRTRPYLSSSACRLRKDAEDKSAQAADHLAAHQKTHRDAEAALNQEISNLTSLLDKEQSRASAIATTNQEHEAELTKLRSLLSVATEERETERKRADALAHAKVDLEAKLRDEIARAAQETEAERKRGEEAIAALSAQRAEEIRKLRDEISGLHRSLEEETKGKERSAEDERRRADEKRAREAKEEEVRVVLCLLCSIVWRCVVLCPWRCVRCAVCLYILEYTYVTVLT